MQNACINQWRKFLSFIKQLLWQLFPWFVSAGAPFFGWKFWPFTKTFTNSWRWLVAVLRQVLLHFWSLFQASIFGHIMVLTKKNQDNFYATLIYQVLSAELYLFLEPRSLRNYFANWILLRELDVRGEWELTVYLRTLIDLTEICHHNSQESTMFNNHVWIIFLKKEFRNLTKTLMNHPKLYHLK